MPSKIPIIATYTDKETIEKFKIVAESNCRSMSKQLDYLIRKSIEEYEAENGQIELPELPQQKKEGI